MDIKKSSVVRTNLTKILNRIVETGEDIGVEQNGETVAVLTRKQPANGVPPLRIGAEQARKGWSKLLECVVTSQAEFSFFAKKSKVIVCLTRCVEYDNPFVADWSTHVAHWKGLQNHPVTGSDIAPLLEQISNRLKHVYGLLKYNPSDRPPQRASDLDRYEVD